MAEQQMFMLSVEQWSEVQRSLGNIETKVETISTDVADLKKSVLVGHQDHETRLRTLEDTRQQQKGVWTFLGIIVAIAFSVAGFIARWFK